MNAQVGTQDQVVADPCNYQLLLVAVACSGKLTLVDPLRCGSLPFSEAVGSHRHLMLSAQVIEHLGRRVMKCLGHIVHQQLKADQAAKPLVALGDMFTCQYYIHESHRLRG